jgi:SAM-dependent methyltransferase
VPSTRREAIIERFGVRPSVSLLVNQALDAALTGAATAARASERAITALDAGCGHTSQLRPFRARIGRLIGADIHRPTAPLPEFDAFAEVDLCRAGAAFEPETFDVILSSFTLEHFAEPRPALANMHRWLVPGGTLVATTVNRRHPFVGAYLALPAAVRDRLQRLVKASGADAHPLLGACNDPGAVVSALEAAGFRAIRVETVGHLARAWGRTWPTFALGLIGDVLARSLPSRRSTIIAVATA